MAEQGGILLWRTWPEDALRRDVGLREEVEVDLLRRGPMLLHELVHVAGHLCRHRRVEGKALRRGVVGREFPRRRESCHLARRESIPDRPAVADAEVDVLARLDGPTHVVIKTVEVVV